MTRYVIDDAMLFDDELYEVSTLNKTAKPMLLGATASRCFAALLEAQGAIVTKKQLLHEGWEQYGQLVSGNSVAQSITQIRRVLARAGAADCVVTVPGIGYKLSDALKIKKSGEFSANTSGKKEHGESAHLKAATLPVERERTLLERYWYSKYFMGVLLGAIMLLNALVAVGWRILQSTNYPLATAISFEYLPIDARAGTQFFISPSLTNSPQRVGEYFRKLETYPPAFNSISKFSYIYFNDSQQDTTYNFFLCLQPLDVSQVGCVTYIIVNEAEP